MTTQTSSITLETSWELRNMIVIPSSSAGSCLRSIVTYKELTGSSSQHWRASTLRRAPSKSQLPCWRLAVVHAVSEVTIQCDDKTTAKTTILKHAEASIRKILTPSALACLTFMQTCDCCTRCQIAHEDDWPWHECQHHIVHIEDDTSIYNVHQKGPSDVDSDLPWRLKCLLKAARVVLRSHLVYATWYTRVKDCLLKDWVWWKCNLPIAS